MGSFGVNNLFLRTDKSSEQKNTLPVWSWNFFVLHLIVTSAFCVAWLTLIFPFSCFPSQPEEYDTLKWTRSYTHTSLQPTAHPQLAERRHSRLLSYWGHLSVSPSAQLWCIEDVEWQLFPQQPPVFRYSRCAVVRTRQGQTWNAGLRPSYGA